MTPLSPRVFDLLFEWEKGRPKRRSAKIGQAEFMSDGVNGAVFALVQFASSLSQLETCRYRTARAGRRVS